jgi:hypothetical protein
MLKVTPGLWDAVPYVLPLGSPIVCKCGYSCSVNQDSTHSCGYGELWNPRGIWLFVATDTPAFSHNFTVVAKKPIAALKSSIYSWDFAWLKNKPAKEDQK